MRLSTCCWTWTCAPFSAAVPPASHKATHQSAMDGDLSQHVQLHKRYPLILAPAAGAAGAEGGALFTLQYQFKPAPLDQRSRGQLTVGASGEASVQLRPGAGADMWAEMGLEDEADQPTESYNFRGVKRPPPSTTEFLLELGAEGVMLRRVGQSVTGLRLHKEQDVRADKLQAAAISRDAKKTLELRKLPKRLQKKPPKKAAETSAAVLAGVVAAAPVTTQQAGDAGDAMEAGIAEDAGDAMEAGIAEDAGDSAGAPEPATSVDLSASAQAIVVQAKAAPECGGKGVPKAEQAVGNT